VFDLAFLWARLGSTLVRTNCTEFEMAAILPPVSAACGAVKHLTDWAVELRSTPFQSQPRHAKSKVLGFAPDVLLSSFPKWKV